MIPYIYTRGHDGHSGDQNQPKTLSGSAQDQQDVAKLSFTNNSISSSVPLLVNNEKVIYENNSLRWDAGQFILRPETVYVQKELLVNGQKPVMSSDVFKVELF